MKIQLKNYLKKNLILVTEHSGGSVGPFLLFGLCGPTGPEYSGRCFHEAAGWEAGDQNVPEWREDCSSRCTGEKSPVALGEQGQTLTAANLTPWPRLALGARGRR